MFNKKETLNKAKKHLSDVIFAIQKSRQDLDETIKMKEGRKRYVSDRDRYIEAEILRLNKKRTEELALLMKSPYFFKCRVKFDDGVSEENVFIAKFSYTEEQIYSWFTGISRLRFEEVGKFSYTLPNGSKRHGRLLQKDQFMITEGQIVYMASEGKDYARELIYQEHLSNRKPGFILPEVIAKMEKNQDEVIRADYRGSYLISGPAGSGKTTLALHRVAYLAQSPDTADNFPGYNIILFVQDELTLEYFKSIFPQLGIDDVVITTFQKWALEILAIKDFQYVYRYGRNDDERDGYEYAKSQALDNYRSPSAKLKTGSLAAEYGNYFNLEQQALFAEQMKEKKLDRFDLALLLRNQVAAQGPLGREERAVVQKKSGELTLENRFIPLKYSLIIVDEVQNYLKEEVAIIKSCISNNNAILYTGDLAQQTKLFTLRNWEQVGEDFSGGRKIVLDKVYRNTKEILRYVEARGYKVFIPDELKSGPAVVEKKFDSKKAELDYVRELVGRKKGMTIGILNRNKEYLADFLNDFAGMDNVHVLTIPEAQGVEFDISILVGHVERAEVSGGNSLLKQEKERVARDLNYVALTRAMEEMHVCFVEEAVS